MSEGVARRNLLGSAVLGAAAALLPNTAQAAADGDHAAPAPDAEITWRLTSSFPKGLDLLYGGAVDFAARVAEITGGRFKIDVFAPGDIAPAGQALDAVQAGTAEACHTSLDYYYGKDPAFAVPTAIPFGMNARQQTAYAFEGGGTDRLNAFLADYGVLALPAGNTGAQMGGFFRREIKSVTDLAGLKVRAGGLAGSVLQRLGAVPQQTPRADLYAALESGALDGVTWVGPYDDARIADEGAAGLQRVAPYYYYPGWWRGGSMVHLVFNKAKFASLPDAFQAAARTAAANTHLSVMAAYDAKNPAALKKLVIGGAQLRAFPQDLLEAAFRAASDIYREIANGNQKFKSLLDATLAFRSDEYLWWQVSEYTFDNFMIRQRARLNL